MKGSDAIGLGEYLMLNLLCSFLDHFIHTINMEMEVSFPTLSLPTLFSVLIPLFCILTCIITW